MKYWPTKTVADVRDLGLDWSLTLEQLADGSLTIADSSWDKLHGDADCSEGVFDDTTATTRVIGGTPDQETVFRNTITLSDGQTLTEDCYLRVRA